MYCFVLIKDEKFNSSQSLFTFADAFLFITFEHTIFNPGFPADLSGDWVDVSGLCHCDRGRSGWRDRFIKSGGDAAFVELGYLFGVFDGSDAHQRDDRADIGGGVVPVAVDGVHRIAARAGGFDCAV